MLDTSNPHRRSRLGAGCISFEKGAHARAFRGCTKTGPPTTTTLRLDTSSFFTQARCSCSPPKAGFPGPPETTTLRLDTSSFFTQAPCSLLAAESWLSHQTSAPARYFLAFYAGSSVWAPELSRVKNRIREECQKFSGFEYQKRIDSMLFLPFGFRSLFGAKSRIREGYQKCLGVEYQTKTYRFHDVPSVWASDFFRNQKSDPRGVPEVLRIRTPKTYRFNEFLPVWAPELFRSQKSDPRGAPEMCRNLKTELWLMGRLSFKGTRPVARRNTWMDL